MENTEEMDIELDIVSLIYRIIKHWRLLIISMIIGIIIMNGVGYLKSRKNAANIQQTINDYQEKIKSGTYDENGNTLISIPEFEKNLSERQINEVTNLVSTYKMYQGPYSNTIDYINNSILMQIDPKAAPTYTIQYFIDTHYSAEYPIIEKKDYTADILNSIENNLLTDETFIEIANALSSDNENIDSTYIKELISTTTSPTANTNSNTDTDVYTIIVCGRTSAECEQIINIIKEKMPDIFKKLKRQYGDFDYTLLSENSYVTYNKIIQSAQQAKADELNNIYRTTQGMIQNLTDDQKAYFCALISNEDTVCVELPIDMNSNEEDIDPSSLEIPSIQKFSIKYSAIGILVGLFITCACIACVVLLKGCLINIEDIETVFGISLLGVWRISPEPKGFFAGIDKLLIRFFDKKGELNDSEEGIQRIITDILLSASKNGWDSLYLATSSKSPSTMEAIDSISDKLKKEIKTINYGNVIFCGPDPLKNLTKSSAVIIIEHSDISRINEIRTEYKLCNRYRLPIIGYVILK